MTGEQFHNELWRNIFDHAPIGTAVIAASGKFLFANRSLCDLLGYSEEEISVLIYDSLIHPLDRNSVQSSIERILSAEIPRVQMEIRCLHRLGSVISIKLSVSLLSCSEGTVYVIAQFQDISGHKQTEQRYDSLIKNNPAAICSINLNGKIDMVNSTFEKISGYSANELMQRTFKSLIVSQNNRPLLSKIEDEQMQENYEVVISHKDGHNVVLGVKDVPIQVDDRIVGFYFVAKDITQLKKTEASLHQTQQELRELVREQQGMIFKFKKIGNKFIHTLCDGELMNRFGLISEHIVGKELIDLTLFEQADEIELLYEKAWNGEELVTYEGELNEITYLASLRPVKQGGEVIEVIGSCIDISERKRAEEELRSTKELLESLIYNTFEAVDIADTKGTILRVNPAFEKMYGYTQEEIIGKNLSILAEHIENEIDSILQRSNDFEPIIGYETTRIRKDGKLIEVNLTVSPITDKAGNLIGFAGISRDITGRKKTEEFLRKSDRLSVVGQLAAGMAHEIRNPLTSLKGFLQILRESISEKQYYFDIMLSELERINFIVSEFLVVAKPQAVKLEMKDVRDLIMNVVALLEPQANLSNIQISVGFDSDDLWIRCSEFQMKQVFINVLKNAIESMEEGGGEIFIKVSDKQEGYMLISITDQGCGIPQDRISELGEPFYTTKEKGTGLGLMMCYQIVEAHEGQMEITSQLHVGTTVNLLLPLANR